MSSATSFMEPLRGMEANLLDNLRAVVQTESPSTDLTALRRCADVIAQVGEALVGVGPTLLEIEGLPHLQWGVTQTANVALIGHFDTVWPVGTLNETPFAIEGGRAVGPGIFDMKTGIIQGLAALSVVGVDQIVLFLNSDEELGSPSSKQYIEELARTVRAVFVLEPAVGKAVKVARKGVATYDLEVLGRAAHAGLEPEKGVNATVAMAHAVLDVVSRSNPDLGTIVTPTTVSVRGAGNVVPEYATVHIDVRAWSVSEILRVDRELRALACKVPSATIQLLTGPGRPPFESKSSEQLFAKARSIAQELGMGELEGVAAGGASDGNFTAGVGTPTLDGLGAVGGGAHARDEHIVVADMLPRSALVAALSDWARRDATLASRGQ
jgi:glutamate carboxypeptidase